MREILSDIHGSQLPVPQIEFSDAINMIIEESTFESDLVKPTKSTEPTKSSVSTRSTGSTEDICNDDVQFERNLNFQIKQEEISNLVFLNEVNIENGFKLILIFY